MKQMRERFATKLQSDLEALLANAPPTPSAAPIAQPSFTGASSSDAASSSLAAPTRPAMPSFVSDDEEERNEESDE